MAAALAHAGGERRGQLAVVRGRGGHELWDLGRKLRGVVGSGAPRDCRAGLLSRQARAEVTDRSLGSCLHDHARHAVHGIPAGHRAVGLRGRDGVAVGDRSAGRGRGHGRLRVDRAGQWHGQGRRPGARRHDRDD
jgi:hypothetical protein